MRRPIWWSAVVLGVAAFVAVTGGAWAGGVLPSQGGGFTDTFSVDPTSLADTGRNPYFILEPGYQLRYLDGADELVITVLPDTELVDGVRTRVVEERESSGGALVEVSRNFFAIDPGSRDVYYFGEDVDDYAGGRVVGHDGSWRSGVGGARFGLMMPGAPAVGQRHQQEIAPGVAMDRAEVVSTTDSVQVPAGGAFTGVLTVRETSPLEPGVTGRKSYAPDIGLVVDDGFELVQHGPAR
jgi:hypothetical protein